MPSCGNQQSRCSGFDDCPARHSTRRSVVFVGPPFLVAFDNYRVETLAGGGCLSIVNPKSETRHRPVGQALPAPPPRDSGGRANFVPCLCAPRCARGHENPAPGARPSRMARPGRRTLPSASARRRPSAVPGDPSDRARRRDTNRAFGPTRKNTKTTTTGGSSRLRGPKLLLRYGRRSCADRKYPVTGANKE